MRDARISTPGTIPALLDRAVAVAGERPAIHYHDETMSYRELERRSRRVAGGLAALGVGHGDRVALWLPNTPAYLILCIACARLGAIAVAVNTRFRSAEVEDTLARTRSKVLVLWPDFRGIDFPAILADVSRDALGSLQALVVYREREGAPGAAIKGARTVGYSELDGPAADSPVPVTADTGCNIFTTSGTTRSPKFVLHSHASIALHASDVAHSFRLTDANAVAAVALPLAGVFGFASAMAVMAAARPMVLMPAFDAEHMLSQMNRFAVTHFNATDDMVARLLDASGDDQAFLRTTMAGYAAFNAALDDIVERAESRGLRLIGLWGMSEMQALVARRDPASDSAERRRAGGRLVSPSARARVRDPDSGRLLAHDEAGELEINGPSRMREYFEHPQATRETITDDGFVRTGDLAVMEAHGGFEFLSRMGDVLRLGGYLVSPAEIEEELKAHPGVASAQVVSAPTPGGERAVAFIIPRAGLGFEADDLRAHCARRLAGYKVPIKFEALEEFPVTMSANGIKIQRTKLRELAAELLTAER